ncbi:MAG: hypothetical protein DRI90_02235 [Deltaproteobacteria bacterium]|nr:MAG: hypothetical protein DRI90_02235 [Deltaproteobacteria bacterium]
MDHRTVFGLVAWLTGATIAGCSCEDGTTPAPEPRGEPINLGFTGISVEVQGVEGVDYAVERVWFDREVDDDLILYIHADVPIILRHNESNLVGAATPWSPGLDPGTIVYRIDGDGLRGYDGNLYQAAPANGQPLDPPLDAIQSQYSVPFTMAHFKGQVGAGPDFHDGIVDEHGDEWHVLSFWDVDPENSEDERDDQTNDGKTLMVVVDPITPAIAFDAPAGEQYYTTPAKLHYVPHIHGQRTYLTAGVQLQLTNITGAEPIHYQVDNGTVQTYGGPLVASQLFGEPDQTYAFRYWLGQNGPQKEREIHFEPIQPGADETHPRMLYPDPQALAAAQAIVAAGGEPAEALLEPPHYMGMPDPPIDFRTGLRYLRETLYDGGYYYQTKRLGTTIKEYARLGVLQEDEGLMRRAVDGLLFMYTIDPLGCESPDGRNGGPCQERCMYSDGRVTINAALAYDLLAGLFTPEQGYTQGMSPIEHLKIRDNLAGEAAMMLQFPTSNPEPFWRTSRASGSPRNLQLEMFIASLAMAMPSYDSHYFGTSGADGVTQAEHLWAPFDDAALSWITINDAGYVEHPADPEQFRYSALHNLVDPDGTYVGQPRDGYLGMMHQDAIPFLIYREHFDGHHYDRFEAYLRMRIMQRYPFNGVMMPQAYYAGGYNSPDAFLGSLVRPDFPDAALYQWALEQPVLMDDTPPADPSIVAAPPTEHSQVVRGYALLSSDLTDPQAVAMRMRVFPPGYSCESGTFQTYQGGAFNIAGYGQRLAIEKAGYHRIEDYHYGTSAQRKNTILIDGQNDPSYLQVRGVFSRSLLTGSLDYAELHTDLSASPESSAYVTQGVDLTRRVIFVDRRYFVIADSLASTTGSHDYDWLLHGATGGGSFAQDEGAGSATWTKPGGERLLLQLLSSATLSSEQLIEPDFIDQDDDQGRPEPYIKATTQGAAAQFLAVLYPLDDGMGDPGIAPLSVTGAAAGEITGGASDGTVVVALRTGTSPLAHQGAYLCDTDGSLCLYKLDDQGEPETLLMVDGTSAALFGTTFSITLGSPGTALLRAAPGGPEVIESTEIAPETR